MTKIPQLRPNSEAISANESLREVARQVLAPLGFPFDDLHAEAALLLNQSGPANSSLLCSLKPRQPEDAIPAKPERRVT